MIVSFTFFLEHSSTYQEIHFLAGQTLAKQKSTSAVSVVLIIPHDFIKIVSLIWFRDNLGFQKLKTKQMMHLAGGYVRGQE